MRRFFLGVFWVILMLGFWVRGVDAWWNTDWTYRMPITINNSLNSSALTNYQVKISLTSANSDFWAHVDSSGKDIRVVDSDDVTKLNYWLKSFDYTGQTAVIWVKVPLIAANSSRTIYLYLANSSVVSESLESNVMEASPQTFWTEIYGSGDSIVGASGITFLSNGDLVVGGNYDSGSGDDWLVRRYNSSGQLIWSRTYDSGGVDDRIYEVVVDSNDNIIVTGYVNGAGNRDWYIRKYSSSGDVLWSKSYDGGSSNDEATSVTVDSSNNVIVTGYKIVGADQRWHTKKYNSSGDEIWNADYDSGNGHDVARDVVVDSSSNIIVAGFSRGSSTNIFYIIKYNSNLNEVWSRSYEKGTSDTFISVDIDSSDNIIVGGYYQEPDGNWLVRKYDSSGNVLWNRLYDSGNGNDTFYYLVVNSEDEIIMVGNTMRTGGVLTDWIIRKYDSSGEVSWTVSEDVDVTDVAASVALNSDDDFGVVGWYSAGGNLTWRIRVYGERQYTNPAPSASIGSLEKTVEKNFDEYIRFSSDSEGIKYISVNNGISLKFLKLPENPSKYWVRIRKIKKWPNNILKSETSKYYWRLRTNLYKAKGKKPFKLRLFFKYTKKTKKKLGVKKLELWFKQGNYVNDKWRKKKSMKLLKKQMNLRTEIRKFKEMKNWYVIKGKR